MYTDDSGATPSLLPLFLSALPINLVIRCYAVPQIEFVARFHKRQTAADVANFCQTLLEKVLDLNVPGQIKLYRSDNTIFREIEKRVPLSELCQTTTVVLFTFDDEQVPPPGCRRSNARG
jgi:hypothetical protein